MPSYFNAEDVGRVIDAAPAGRDKLFLTFLWRTGCRASEALAVTGLDINLSVRELRIMKGKGNKRRIIPIHPELAQALSVINVRPNEKLFPFSYDTALDLTQKAIARAGVWAWGIDDGKRKPGCHVLRHSAARHWLASGRPVNQVAGWLGHSSPLTTLRIYEVLSPDDAGDMAGIK